MIRRLILATFLLLATFSLGQSWSGILSPSRAIDWSNTGLPPTFPDGETTTNPWTPPTRTQCVTSQCNTVSTGSVTATTVNAAIASAAAGTYVLVPAGTFAIGGTINMKSNVTLRGSGAASTKFTGGSINWGGPSGQSSWGSGSLLTGSITKGGTSVTILSGQTVPSAGRMVALSQCMTGMTAPDANYTHFTSDWVTKCTGPIADPSGPWVCGGLSQCDVGGNRGETNPHFLGQIFWASGVSGNTVTFTTPITSPLWSTGNSASLMAMTSAGTTGAGLEGLTSVNWIEMDGCYACWMKGLRVIFSDGNPRLDHFVSHSLFANNMFAATTTGLHTVQLGDENDTTVYDSDSLVLNNIWYTAYLEEDGGNQGLVLAYNYFLNTVSGNTYSGDFPHNPGGQQFMLREGNQDAINQDDAIWTAHNFDTFFRNWASGFDSFSGATTYVPINVDSFSRFDNVVGNVIGSPQAQRQDYGGVLGINFQGADTTGLTTASSMRWGNYVFCTGDPHCQVPAGAFDSAEVPTNLSSFGVNSTPYQNPLPASHTLPASFFMNNMGVHPNGGTGLSWWKTCSSWTTFPTTCASLTTPPMPPIGPDVTGGQNINGHAYNIPAFIAFNSFPTDPSFGNGIRQFDERVYAVDGVVPAVNNYYVATTGSDSNPGTQAQPWATINHADAALVLGSAGAIVNVAPGTYNVTPVSNCSGESPTAVCTSKVGTSVAPVIYQCTTQFACTINVGPSTASSFGWVIAGNFQTVKGFTLVGQTGTSVSTMTFEGILVNITASNATIQGNDVSNIAMSGCISAAGIGESQSSHDNSFIGNRVHLVHNVSDSCNFGEGIYLAAPRGIAQDNIVWQVHGNAINTGHLATSTVVTNNTLFNNGFFTGSGFIGGGTQIGGCTGAGETGPNSSTIMSNNIIFNNPGIAVWLSGCVGTNNAVRNNIIFGNGNNTVFCNTNATQCGTVAISGTVNSSPQFVNYQPNGTGDYHPQPGSPAIAGGTSICASGGLSPCVPPTDFSGNVQTIPPVIGYLVATSAGVPIVNFSPSPLAFGTVPVGTSNTLTETLTNTGAANLTFSAATITGTNASVFTIASTTCGSPLGAGLNCTYTITATPSAAGLQSASLTLNDNASGSPHQVPLSVTGGTVSLTLNPTSLNFGAIAPGSCSASQTDTITSSGTSPLVITAPFAFSNPVFTFGTGGTCTVNQSLAPGQSCLATVKFCPTVAGAQSGNLSIPTNAPGSPSLLSLSGTGASSTATLLPATFNFGNQQVGTSSGPQTFTYTNTGTLALSITAVTVNSTSYTVTDNCPRSPATLALSGTCQVNVVFSPVSAGVFNAVVTVTGDATQTSAVSGTGTLANITLSPTTVNFGSVLVGTNSASTTVTITNTGAATATLGSITTAAPFNLTSNTCGATLIGGASCAVGVRFSPTATGLVSGQLVVPDNAPGNPHTAALSGTGIAPVGSLSPSTHDFGSQTVGATTSAFSFTWSNTGTAPMTWTASLAGTDPGDYVLGANSCSNPLPAGQNCLIPVSFKPTTSGARPATLSIANSSSVTPITASLTGTGVATAPAVCLNPASINFGNIPVGSTSGSLPVLVTNCGNANLVVSSVTPTGDFTQTNNCTTVTPGGTCTINGKFAPTVAGARTGNLSIASNAASSPDLVSLQGFGTQVGATLTPTSVNFGTVVVGVQSAGTVLTLSNTGNISITVNTPTLTGTNPSDFSFGGGCATLAVNASCTYTVFFTPGGAGARSGTFNQSFTGGGSPVTVALSGTGQATAPAVTLIPTSINFGSITQGVATAVSTIQLNNSGTANLTVTSVTATGANSGDVTLSADNCTGATLIPGQNCTVGSSMTPGSTGARSANAHFITNAASSPNDVALTVIGLVAPAPQATFSPSTTIAFGNVKTNTSSAGQVETVGNAGNANLNVLSVTLGGANPSQYSQTNNCSTVLPSGSCAITVNCTPTSVGSKPATLVIASNDPTTPSKSVNLTCTGKGRPRARVGVTNINFGNTTVGTTSTALSFTVTNIGDDTLNVSNIGTTGDTFPQNNTCVCCPVAPSASCTVQVQFAPQILCGQFDLNLNCISNVHPGSLTVTSDADNGPQTVTLQGTAVPIPPPPGPIKVTMGGKLKVGGHLKVGVQ